jgi:ribulose-bisphosphate carboxylase small chain
MNLAEMRTLPFERRYETFSYLPPLTDNQIIAQISYMLEQGFNPGLEFSKDLRPEEYYWTMWKLPFFGCSNPQTVISELRECKQQYPDCYIRVVGFDNIKQCQTMSFIVHKPGSGSRY